MARRRGRGITAAGRHRHVSRTDRRQARQVKEFGNWQAAPTRHHQGESEADDLIATTKAQAAAGAEAAGAAANAATTATAATTSARAGGGAGARAGGAGAEAEGIPVSSLR